MNDTVISQIFICDHNEQTNLTTIKGWTRKELCDWLMNFFGEVQITHLDEKHYTITIQTYNYADTEQITKEIKAI